MRGQVKYYFKQPKGAIVKDMLTWIAVAGVITIAASSPYFVRSLLRSWEQGKKHKIRSKEATFYRMRKQGLLQIEQKGRHYHIALTSEGRKKARWVQLDSLQVQKPKQWKNSWYFLLFDVAQAERWKRDILRSFLERMQFMLFQRSIWVHAHDCRAEIDVLLSFLDLSPGEVKLVIVPDKGLVREDSRNLRKYFNIS
ncbi:MAG TPA: hypothetical protein VGA53_01645 [Candidatus Paceibacterota bacterium]